MESIFLDLISTTSTSRSGSEQSLVKQEMYSPDPLMFYFTNSCAPITLPVGCNVGSIKSILGLFHGVSIQFSNNIASLVIL